MTPHRREDPYGPSGLRALVARGFAAPADRTVLLDLMDLNMWEMYRAMVRVARGGEVLETETLTLVTTASAAFFNNLLLVRGPVDATTVGAAAAEFYGRRGRGYTVLTRAHADAALEEELRGQGYRLLVREPGMALLADPGTRVAAPELAIRAVTDDAGRRAFQQVSAEAYASYQQPRGFTDEVFATLASVHAPAIQGFVGWVEGEAVAAAALYMTPGVAGVGWVGTVPARRGRRYAEAVTWAVVRAGLARGGAFATLQASPMGGAVYARMGFATPTHYHLHVPPDAGA